MGSIGVGNAVSTTADISYSAGTIYQAERGSNIHRKTQNLSDAAGESQRRIDRQMRPREDKTHRGCFPKWANGNTCAGCTDSASDGHLIPHTEQLTGTNLEGGRCIGWGDR